MVLQCQVYTSCTLWLHRCWCHRHNFIFIQFGNNSFSVHTVISLFALSWQRKYCAGVSAGLHSAVMLMSSYLSWCQQQEAGAGDWRNAYTCIYNAQWAQCPVSQHSGTSARQRQPQLDIRHVPNLEPPSSILTMMFWIYNFDNTLPPLYWEASVALVSWDMGRMGDVWFIEQTRHTPSPYNRTLYSILSRFHDYLPVFAVRGLKTFHSLIFHHIITMFHNLENSIQWQWQEPSKEEIWCLTSICIKIICSSQCSRGSLMQAYQYQSLSMQNFTEQT